MENRMELGKVEPNAFKAIMDLENYIGSTYVDKKLLHLIKIRASQVNGCAFCIDMHTKEAKKDGETEQRIYALSAWRETPFFNDEERAVLALTESVTLVSKDHVPDEIYETVKRFFDDKTLAQIIMAIVTVNAWNRVAITTRMIPGTF
jgi:AhpD family alkylhydroperoxidase